MIDKDVRPGQLLSARLWNAVIATVKRSRPLQGRGIILRQTPQGTVIEAAGSPAPEFIRGRVTAIKDTQGQPITTHVVPSSIVYSIRVPSRPDLGVLAFGAGDPIIRDSHDDTYHVWPMKVDWPVCLMIDKTGDAQAPEKLWLVAIEAPFAELCSTPPGGGA